MDTAHDKAPRSAIAIALGYTLMIAAVVAAYLGIRWYGDTLSAPAPIVAAATARNRGRPSVAAKPRSQRQSDVIGPAGSSNES
jgi:hypothetical protein